MKSIIFMLVILILYLCFFLSPFLLFCDTPIQKQKKLKINKKIESFTSNFIQIYPQSGQVPLIVTFAPVYKNDFSPFIIDFGDTTKYIGQTTDIFMHTYNDAGVYNGTITYELPNIPTKTIQKFQIIVTI